jgi:hypothetical protein
VIDRCYLHGTETKDAVRGVALNSAWSAIIDSYLSDFHATSVDSQAIGGWGGPGPFKIVNNFLSGAGENVLFGGADPRIVGLVPSDIEFRRNHVFKPFSWKVGDPAYAGIRWTVKNSELKNAQRVSSRTTRSKATGCRRRPASPSCSRRAIRTAVHRGRSCRT